MEKVLIIGIICLTVIILAYMLYDLRRLKIAADEKKSKTRTVEKEVIVEVPVPACSGAKRTSETTKIHDTERGSVKGFYVGQDKSVSLIDIDEEKDR